MKKQINQDSKKLEALVPSVTINVMCRVQFLVLFLATFLGLQQPASAFHFSGFDEGDKGIGLLLGSPLGLRYESWADWKRAYLIDVGYGANQTLLGSFNHIWSAYDVEDYWKSSGLFNSLIFSYGLGAFVGYRLDSGDKTPVQAGVRGLVGFQHMFGRGNFSLRFEAGPALALVGDQAVTLQGAISLIYYFGGPIQGRTNSKSEGNLEFDSKDFDQEEGKIRGPSIPARSKSTLSKPKSQKGKSKKSKNKKEQSLDEMTDEDLDAEFK